MGRFGGGADGANYLVSGAECVEREGGAKTGGGARYKPYKRSGHFLDLLDTT